MKLELHRLSALAALVALVVCGPNAAVLAATAAMQPRLTTAAKLRPDKPAAPIEILLATATTPINGEAIRVDVTLKPRVDVSGIELRILPSAGLILGSPDVQVLGPVAAGETVATSFHLTPRSGGRLRVGVLAIMDTATGRQTRPAMLSLHVKGAATMASSKPDTRIQTTPAGERVVVFQGR